MPIILKGVNTAEDARLAVEHGCAAVIVSNHGGRQLDFVKNIKRIFNHKKKKKTKMNIKGSNPNLFFVFFFNVFFSVQHP